MKTSNANTATASSRSSAIDMSADEFRAVGHSMIDRIADFLDTLPERPVTSGELPQEIKGHLPSDAPLPERGADAAQVLERASRLLFDHSLFNGHPRFMGYITSSPAPIGMLADLLASAVNANCGGWMLSPMASEIELQTVRWISELIGYSPEAGGALVSGGNIANLVGVWAARAARANWDVRQHGLLHGHPQCLRMYASAETHTWIQKAADLMGLGTDSIRWIETDKHQRIDPVALRDAIKHDRAQGDRPFVIIGTAGSVSTGVTDPLDELATIAKENDIWYHVDGAYGGFAAALPEYAEVFKGMDQADSVAVDPHKWLYAPLEAGCALVRNREALRQAFSYHPPYYHFGVEAVNFVDFGPQNSRGFRALKVWLALQHVGKSGYVKMIGDDIDLAGQLYDIVADTPELEALTQHLSITTFRYIPDDLHDDRDHPDVREYLNELNTEIQDRLERGGELFLSNAIIDKCYALRACVVNFRTSLEDMEAVPEIVLRVGKHADNDLRPDKLRR